MSCMVFSARPGCCGPARASVVSTRSTVTPRGLISLAAGHIGARIPAYDGHRDLLKLPRAPQGTRTRISLRVNTHATELRRFPPPPGSGAAHQPPASVGQPADACHLVVSGHSTIPSARSVGTVQNGIFCRVGYLLADAREVQELRTVAPGHGQVGQRSAGPPGCLEWYCTLATHKGRDHGIRNPDYTKYPLSTPAELMVAPLLVQVRGSQLKKRTDASRPARPQAATTTTSVQLNAVPRNPACMPLAKCQTGKIRAIHTIHAGALLPSGMKTPDRNSSGRIDALTIAGAASAFGMTAVTANPSAQKLAAPTSNMTRNRSSVRPVGMLAL